jgi:hypothetical protein
MTAIQGEGEYRYAISNDWAKVPPGMEWREVGAIAVDLHDNVYVFNRGPHPMMVFDRDGNFLRSWGEGLFPRAHGAHFAPDETLWLTDDADHTVRRCTLDGKVLMTLGIPGRPAPYMSQEPFHRCTHTALSPEGDIYVSDGYGNARVHKFAPDGRLLLSWAGPAWRPASSTCRTTSAAMPTAGSMSPIARAIACRCSTATAATRPNGATCIGRAASTCRPASARSAMSASAARRSRSIATRRTSGRGSASSPMTARCWRGSATSGVACVRARLAISGSPAETVRASRGLKEASFVHCGCTNRKKANQQLSRRAGPRSSRRCGPP